MEPPEAGGRDLGVCGGLWRQVMLAGNGHLCECDGTGLRRMSEEGPKLGLYRSPVTLMGVAGHSQGRQDAWKTHPLWC